MIKDKKILARMADEDLRTPSHDAIMVWLHENTERVCRSLLDVEIDSQRSQFTSSINRLTEEDLGLIMKDLGKDELGFTVKTFSKWEAPVKSGNVIIGFIDLLSEVSASGCPWVNRYDHYGTPVVDVRHGNGYNVTIAFEVKTTIRSLGETIRQINTYRAYMRSDTRFCIVSPDDRFRAILESQGILFVKAPAVGDSGAQGGLF